MRDFILHIKIKSICSDAKSNFLFFFPSVFWYRVSLCVALITLELTLAGLELREAPASASTSGSTGIKGLLYHVTNPF